MAQRLPPMDSNTIKRHDLNEALKASQFLSKIMSEHWIIHKDEQLNYFFLTLIDDSGVTSDRSPEARIKYLKEKVVRSLRNTTFDAIAMVEKHPVMNYPRKGRAIFFQQKYGKLLDVYRAHPKSLNRLRSD